MKHFLTFLIFICALQPKAQSVNSGSWTTLRIPHSAGAIQRYDFFGTDSIKFTFNGDLLSYSRNGVYVMKDDSILITYNPFPEGHPFAERTPSPFDFLIVVSEKCVKAHGVELCLYRTDKIIESFKTDSIQIIAAKILNIGFPLVLDQFQFNKWNCMDTLPLPPDEYIELETYKLPLHSGKNAYRIRQVGGCGEVIHHFSIESVIEKITITYDKKEGLLKFSAMTYYQLHDAYGNLARVGNSTELDVSVLSNGTYFLSFDNQTEKIKVANNN